MSSKIMRASEIKEEVEHFDDIKVKLEENSSSVVYEVGVTSKVDMKIKKEDPPQSPRTSVTKHVQSAIDIKVKPERDPTNDKLELEPKLKNTYEGESESDSNEQEPQQIKQSSQTRSIRNKQNTTKIKKRIVKTQNNQIQCPFCPQFFPGIAPLITHARSKHAIAKNASSQSTSDDETLIQCPLCPTFFKSVETIQSHFIRIHVTSKPFQCSVCLESTNEIKKFPTEYLLKKHMKQTHDPARFKFQCDICSRKFPSPFNCKRHKATHFRKQYKCEYCNKEFRKKESLLRHIIAVHKEYTDRHETFKCDECKQLFGSKNDLDGHVLQTHEVDTVECKVCFKKFKDEVKLRNHLEVSHRENRTWLVCDVCSKVFNNNQNLVTHLEVEHKRFFKCRKCFRSFVSEQEYDGHSTENPDEKEGNVRNTQLQCKICLVFLSTECSFTTHKDTHLNKSEIEKKIITHLDPDDPQDCVLKCDFCPKTFVQKSLLLDHARKCHPNQKWKCKSCEKSFQVKFQLNKHELLHSTNKLFECQVCHKGFANLKCLQNHEGIHKINKKFKCSQCEKSFAFSNKLKLHMANYHGGVKLFKCDICKMKFAYKRLLVQHSRVHTDERPFSCSKCSYSSKRVYELRRHQQGIHSGNRLKKYKKLMSNPVRFRPHLKYLENLVYICNMGNCYFETKEEKEVALHYAKHNLPKVILPRLVDGPAGEVFLSKFTWTNKHMIQARYKCAQCLKIFSRPDSLPNHTRTFHTGKKPKRKKRICKMSSSDEDE